MTKLLLISCSLTKSKILRGPCRVIYRGRLFRLALRYAELARLSVKILSSKYGWIEPSTIIDNYNQIMKGTYKGEWPEGEGFWVGGVKYFKHVPDRFKLLVSTESHKIGLTKMEQELKSMINALELNDENRKARWLRGTEDPDCTHR